MAPQTRGSAADFDFLTGDWTIRNLRLKQRFAGCTDWDEFPATSSVRKLLQDTANLEEMDIPTKGFAGITLRLFNPRDGSWSLHWADTHSNVLFPPVIGHFEGGKGVFYGDDLDDGVPVRVQFLWIPSPETPRWEQAFSRDGGETWETNWVMKFTRA
ncbi:hypothetical protein HB779_06015 [Phyllobacterium sp. 628]|uniref:hypothetical protein n=1 Tax=Phyllobacterium sp. 628 TaxID=2718938 RepID=UPI0016623DD9|nr:hypothetical protein [Phyllobacterium sp. 628]QND51503.1 hypothetical protein HB779_06015 [Phyllobacterium sp. 628]